MLLAPLIVGEKLSWRDLVVNATVILGTVISVYFGPHGTPQYALDNLIAFFKATQFIIYAIFFIMWVIALLLANYTLSRDWSHSNKYVPRISPKHRNNILRFSYPAIAGSMGGASAMFAKSSIELAKTTLTTSDNQFKYPVTYVVVTLMVVLVVVQVRFLNMGLQRYPALYVVPVYQVFWILSGILGGLFFFDEAAHFTTIQWVMFPLGASISLMGILIHARRSHDEASAIAMRRIRTGSIPSLCESLRDFGGSRFTPDDAPVKSEIAGNLATNEAATV
jgi:magnesium transporter